MSVKSKLLWAQQILSAVSSLHRHNILHGDLKPENCLLAQDLSIRLCDFNSAYQLDTATSTAKRTPASAAFMSPESIQTNTFGLPSDIWAYGCLLFELFTLQCPFRADTDYLSMRKVLENDFVWTAPLRSPFDRQLTNPSPLEEFYVLLSELISDCLEQDPTKRITAETALLHPVFACPV